MCKTQTSRQMLVKGARHKSSYKSQINDHLGAGGKRGFRGASMFSFLTRVVWFATNTSVAITSGYISKENESTNSKRYMCTNAHSSISYNCQDMEETYMCTDRWTMEYYSAMKKDEILPYATRVDLWSIMLSEISQTEKTNIRRYHLSIESKKQNECVYQNRNRFMDAENKLLVTTGEHEERRGKIGEGDSGIQKTTFRASTVVQWLRTSLAMQWAQVSSLVGELRSHMPRGN